MKLKNILGIVVSALTIMVGGYVLVNLVCNLLSFLESEPEFFAGITGEEFINNMLQLSGYFAATVVLVIAAKILLTKEQLKHTIFAVVFAALLLAILFFIGIVFLHGSGSKLIVVQVIGAVALPIIGYFFVKRANWTYIFATVYASSLIIYVLLFITVI